MSDLQATALLEASKLGIAQIFLEEAQFRHRTDPLDMSVGQQTPPTPAEISLDLRASSDGGSVAVRLRVESKAPEATYFYSVSYIVLFTIGGAMSEQLGDQLLVIGGTMAMPFVREAVANLSQRGRYGPTWLSPVNFSDIVKGKRREETPSQAP